MGIGAASAYADPEPASSGASSTAPSTTASSSAAGSKSPKAASATPSSRAVRAAAPTTTVTGVVYGDANDSGAFDPGEGLAHVALTLQWVGGPGSGVTLTTTSGASGAFSFPKVPPANYVLYGTGPGGWIVILRTVSVGTTPGAPLQLRAVRPLNGALHATLAFDKHRYRMGDHAVVTITLRNSGSRPLIGITADCNHVGDADEVNSSGPGWGALASEGAGVTIPAGQTVTFHIPESVPAAARTSGIFAAACDFGYEGSEPLSDRPNAADRALVPGGFGDVNVQVSTYAQGLQGPGVGRGGVRLVLVNRFSCPFTAQGTTTSTGAYTFTHLPAGFYTLYLYPPAGWKSSFQNPTGAFVIDRDNGHMFVQLVPGSAALPANPPPPSTDCISTATPPAPASTPTPPAHSPVAATGANTAPLLALGLILAIVGSGLTTLGRRRRIH